MKNKVGIRVQVKNSCPIWKNSKGTINAPFGAPVMGFDWIVDIDDEDTYTLVAFSDDELEPCES